MRTNLCTWLKLELTELPLIALVPLDDSEAETEAKLLPRSSRRLGIWLAAAPAAAFSRRLSRLPFQELSTLILRLPSLLPLLKNK